MADILSDYLAGLNEDLIKDNFVIVYEVREAFTCSRFLYLVIFCMLILNVIFVLQTEGRTMHMLV